MISGMRCSVTVASRTDGVAKRFHVCMMSVKKSFIELILPSRIITSHSSVRLCERPIHFVASPWAW
jgi:hypothetical protein